MDGTQRLSVEVADLEPVADEIRSEPAGKGRLDAGGPEGQAAVLDAGAEETGEDELDRDACP